MNRDHLRDDSMGETVRKWGPLTGIVAALAVIGALVLTRPAATPAPTAATIRPETAGPEGPRATTTLAPPTPATTGAPADIAPDAPISFSRAVELGLDVTFPEACDPATGRVAIPYYFAPECYADRPGAPLPDGGATDRGVTADTITVVVYQSAEDDPVLEYVTGVVDGDDTNADQRATIEGYAALFEEAYQTYGRHVELVFLEASGAANDEIAARADAVKAIEEHAAFAVWGGPALTSAWSEEIAARGALCIHCPAPPADHPNIFSTTPTLAQNGVILAEYVVKKLVGRPAVFAGDPAMRDRERVLGHLYIETGEHSAAAAEALADVLTAAGTGFAVQLAYALDPARLQEQATTTIARLKDRGVTTVVVQADPVAMGTFTSEASAQGYFPEWVIGPSTLIDTAAYGRTYDQTQWAHAFGLSPRAAPVDRERVPSLYEWRYGSRPPGDDNEAALMAMPAIFYGAVQRAGPNLTTDSLRAALYATEPVRGSVTAPGFSYGEHGLFPTLPGPDQGGVDNWAEIWWDPDAEGPDELGRQGRGMYRYVDGGQRAYAGELTERLDVFDPEGTVTLFTEQPRHEAERIGTYPPPTGR